MAFNRLRPGHGVGPGGPPHRADHRVAAGDKRATTSRTNNTNGGSSNGHHDTQARGVPNWQWWSGAWLSQQGSTWWSTTWSSSWRMASRTTTWSSTTTHVHEMGPEGTATTTGSTEGRRKGLPRSSTTQRQGWRAQPLPIGNASHVVMGQPYVLRGTQNTMSYLQILQIQMDNAMMRGGYTAWCCPMHQEDFLSSCGDREHWHGHPRSGLLPGTYYGTARPTATTEEALRERPSSSTPAQPAQPAPPPTMEATPTWRRHQLRPCDQHQDRSQQQDQQNQMLMERWKLRQGQAHRPSGLWWCRALQQDRAPWLRRDLQRNRAPWQCRALQRDRELQRCRFKVYDHAEHYGHGDYMRLPQGPRGPSYRGDTWREGAGDCNTAVFGCTGRSGSLHSWAATTLEATVVAGESSDGTTRWKSSTESRE